MTLYQMSFVYREDALRFRMRITVLREQAKAAPTKEERERLKRRILELQQLQRQSRELASRFEFEKEIAGYAAKFGLGKGPRPPHWSGFRITPLQIEFWRDRPFRLHDRLVFSRANAAAGWTTAKLFP